MNLMTSGEHRCVHGFGGYNEAFDLMGGVGKSKKCVFVSAVIYSYTMRRSSVGSARKKHGSEEAMSRDGEVLVKGWRSSVW